MSRNARTTLLTGIFCLGLGLPVRAQSDVDLERVSNWAAPLFWSASHGEAGIEAGAEKAGKAEAAVDLTVPLPFTAVTPCRVVDTRLPPGPFGAPPLAAAVARNFAIPAGPCVGIPATAGAYSVNVTVTNTLGPGFIQMFPQDGIQTAVSTVNYLAGQTVANAAVVPAGTGGGVTVVAGVSGTDVIIDINGYYAGSVVNFTGALSGEVTGTQGATVVSSAVSTNTANAIVRRNAAGGFSVGTVTLAGNLALPAPTGGTAGVITVFGIRLLHSSGVNNTFLGLGAGNFTMAGSENTASGASALDSNTTGSENTASGAFALTSNTTGNANTANGYEALESNTAGRDNTAGGENALGSNTIGSYNTASGKRALRSNTDGDGNTATGGDALGSNTTGSYNTAVGYGALNLNTTGGRNIAVGNLAGHYLTGTENIAIGNAGIAGESRTIRIGDSNQWATYIAGISGRSSPGGIGVFVNGDGKLGTTLSSRRVKEDIREIADESEGLMKLRPVAFRYKAEIDPTGLAQYGLIAEEVAEVYPDLVVVDRDGEPETVRYHLINALLLSEVQKQHRTAQAQEREIVALRARLAALETALRVKKAEN